jgi:YidC/Oxa1 family membrane protein insertase
VLPDVEDQATVRFQRFGQGDNALDGEVYEHEGTLAPGEALTWKATVYAGENHLSTLSAVSPKLERVVDLGWFAMFGWPLLKLLQLFHGLLGDWGLSIVAVTVGLKLVFFPLTQRAMKSTQGMAAIQPEIAKLKEQYADDPTELNRRTLELMATHQVNPVTGCLPMLVQTPVFVAFYNVLLTNVEFYQQKFLYLKDLSSPDPYCILPLLVTGLMWGQQQLTAAPQNMDPSQQAVLKWMPLMFGLFFFTSPSGLGVYFFVNMSLSILQQWVIKRSLGTGSKVPPMVGVNP